MLGIIWVFIILISCLYAFFAGNIAFVNDAFFAGASGCVEFVLKVGAFMVLWQGVLNVAQKSGLSQKLSKLLAPLICFLFKDVKKESKEANLIANNISANMLGLSNDQAILFGLILLLAGQKENIPLIIALLYIAM